MRTPSLLRRITCAVSLPAFALLAVVAVRAGLARAADDDLILIRVSVSSAGAQPNRDSGLPAVDSGGRFVGFESDARNLVPGDTNRARDIFVHDLESGGTVRVSVSTGGEQGNGHSRNASISADGRYVAFESRAGNLVSGDTNRTTDVFVHDRESGQTERVSVSGDGSQGDKESTDPSISADGRFVAYASEAGNLVAGDTNREQDIFVHDRETGKTTRVSVASDGSEAEDDSQQPSISGDGRFVAFASEARNLVPGDTNRKQDIFVHDRETGETRRVSLSSGGTEGDRDGETPVISAQGRFVAFTSEARNLVAGDTNRKADVFVHDRQTGETTRVSVGNDGRQASGGSGAPSISASGRFVAFESVASGLVEGDKNKAKDVFVRDRSRELTIRTSVGREGRPRDDSSSDDSSEEDGSSDDKSDDSSDGDSSDDSDDRGSGDSDHPFLSGDGAFVAFRSEASNLVHGDTNGRNDVFLAAVGLIPPPEVVDDERSTPAGTPIDIDVLANDTGDVKQ